MLFRSDLEQAVERADLGKGRIVIVNLNSRTPLDYDDILFLNSDGPYVHFHTTDGRVVTGTHGLNFYSKQLNSNVFQRSHRSFLVNLSQVETALSDKDGGGTVIIKGYGKPIPIAKRRRKEFMEALEGRE